MNVLSEYWQFLRILDKKAMILLFHSLILTNLRAERSEPLSSNIEVFCAVYNCAGIVGLIKGFVIQKIIGHNHPFSVIL